jgi:hypothetical protein
VGWIISNDTREYRISIKASQKVGKKIGKGEFAGEKFFVYEEIGKDEQEYILVVHENYQGGSAPI